MAPAFVGLGANVGDPKRQLLEAFAALARIPRTRLLKRSSLYLSAPLGFTAQPDFVNAVAMLRTGLAARELLLALLDIERGFGRTRDFANAPRTLDLDLLLYGRLAVDEPGLTLPHPRIAERAFVLAPLVEIAPRATIPGRGAAAALLAACAGQTLRRLPD